MYEECENWLIKWNRERQVKIALHLHRKCVLLLQFGAKWCSVTDVKSGSTEIRCRATQIKKGVILVRKVQNHSGAKSNSIS